MRPADKTGSLQAHGLDSQLAVLLRHAAQRANVILARRLRGTGLSVPRFIVLTRLLELGPLSQNRLGRLAAMEPANIHDMVRSLKAQRLVEAQPDPADRRRLLVALTPTGRDLIERVQPAGRAAHEELLRDLEAGDRQALARLLAPLCGDVR